MANICENTISITGPKSDLYKKLSDAAEKGEFCETIVPSPNGEWDWDFSVTNWGTKWEPEFMDNDVSDESFGGYCQTAWSPPLEALATLKKQNPELDIECFYWEPGMDFAGKWHNGTDEEITISDFPMDETKLTPLQEELDGMFDIIGMKKMWEDDEQEEELTEEDKLRRYWNSTPEDATDIFFFTTKESKLVKKFGKPVDGKWVIETYETAWDEEYEEYFTVPDEATVTVYDDCALPYKRGTKVYRVEGDVEWLYDAEIFFNEIDNCGSVWYVKGENPVEVFTNKALENL